MDSLIVLNEYQDGSVLVGDELGSTQFLTKSEYSSYLKNRSKAKKHIVVHEKFKNPV